jgi:hypothetical protein
MQMTANPLVQSTRIKAHAVDQQRYVSNKNYKDAIAIPMKPETKIPKKASNPIIVSSSKGAFFL